MKKTKVNIYTDCINIYFDGELAMKFAEYQLKNWEDLPCFRGGGMRGQSYNSVFFAESLPCIEKFFEENKKELKINLNLKSK
jgi:hypothetical protein